MHYEYTLDLQRAHEIKIKLVTFTLNKKICSFSVSEYNCLLQVMTCITQECEGSQ